MHIYVLVYGQKMWLDKFVNDLQAQYVNWKDDNGRDILLQLGVREIKLLDIAFPREQIDKVIGYLGPFRSSGISNLRLAALRKILGLKKLDYNRPIRQTLPRRYVDTFLVGYKPDVIVEGRIEMI